jgi:hypothetical protein
MGELPKFNGDEILKGMESEHQEAFEKNKKIIEANTKKNGELTQEIIDNLKGREDSQENDPLDDKLQGLTGAIETLRTMRGKSDPGYEAAKQNVIKGVENLSNSLGNDEKEISETLEEIEKSFKKGNEEKK